MAAQVGLIAVLNNDDLQKREDAADQARYAASNTVPGEAPPDPYSSILCDLDSYVENCWQAAKTAKEGQVEPDMLEDLRQREGIYDPTKLAEIRKHGGSEIKMMLTNVKCRAAEGWIRDILLPSGERPFTVRPSPIPNDMPPELKQGIYQRTMAELQEVMQAGIYPTQQQVYDRARQMYDQMQQRIRDEAKLRAQRMEDSIDDKLVEGAWYDAMEAMIADLVALQAAFVKGPVVRKNRRLVWETDEKTGKSVPRAEDELTPMFYSPSPLDIYPSPDSRDTEDGYLVEKIPLRRSALEAMKGVPSYNDEKISAALEEYQHHGHEIHTAGEQERRDIENATNYQISPDRSIDSLEFHGSIRGQWLLDWGMKKGKGDGQVDDPDTEYEVTCLKVGRFVVRCVLNEDPLRRRPYMKASYDSIKGQFWGRGLPRLIRDIQNICDACARALSNNMGLASGPMIEVEVDRLAEGEDPTMLYPWRLFQTKASKSTPSPAVHFHQPDTIVAPLMKVYQYFSGLADDYSGIPKFDQGINPTQGAAGTATGLSMLMTASSRQIKRIFGGIDRMIEGSVQRMHTWIMLFGDDPNVKGDANIEARGTASLVAKEQLQIRRAQFLAQTANPMDAQIMGPLGRAELLRGTAKSLDYNPDDIIPSRDEMMSKMQQQSQPAAQPSQPMLPAPGAPTLDAAGNPAGGTDHALFQNAA
jgi:hypothetical protein